MTFESTVDVWEAESLRTSNPVGRLRAAEIIRMAATGAFDVLRVAGAPSAWKFGCVMGAWTRAWRQTLSRKIDWAAVRFAMVSRALEAWALLNDAIGRPAAVEPLRPHVGEAEVATSASA